MSRLNLVFAAVNAALEELTGHEEIATVLSVANRAHPDRHNSVGWLADEVIVLSRPAQLHTPPEYFQSLRSSIVDALASANVPWSTVIYDTAPAAFGTTTDIPHLAFVAESQKMSAVFNDRIAGNLKLHVAPMNTYRADQAIDMFWTETSDSVRASLVYKGDWYPAHAITDLWEACLSTLHQIAAT